MKRRFIDRLDALVLECPVSHAVGLESATLESLAVALGCDWATYWLVDPLQPALRPYAQWTRRPMKAEQLTRDTMGRALSLSEGNAGHVWRSRKPVWSQDIALDMCLPRSLDAKAAGFSGGIWFAVQTSQTVYGVVELLGEQLPPGTPDLRDAVERLGLTFGELMQDEQSKKHPERRMIRNTGEM